MKITVLCSSTSHPVYEHLEKWCDENRNHHSIELVNSVSETSEGDLLFLISCSDIVTTDVRDRYSKSLVIHASDLPKGKGWSPHIWQVLEGSDSITVSLLEAEDKVDTGKIWGKRVISLEGHELYNEINSSLFSIELELMDYAVEKFGTIEPQKQPDIEPSYYKKRTPNDSEVSVDSTISEIFNLLRVSDPNRFPAFFNHLGHKYTIEIKKVKE